jgi:HSP20 family protein
MFGTLMPWRARFPATFGRFEREMNELLGRVLPEEEEFWTVPKQWFAPRVNVAETEKAYEVTMEVPGIDPKEVNVEVREGALWVNGEKKEEKEEKGKTFHRLERYHGAFRRVIPFELPVNREKVEAKYHDGVLTIMVPKMPQAEAKRIEVKAH